MASGVTNNPISPVASFSAEPERPVEFSLRAGIAPPLPSNPAGELGLIGPRPDPRPITFIPASGTVIDYNDDGIDDARLTDELGNSRVVTGDGNGGIAAVINPETGESWNVKLMLEPDLNGDGIKDVILVGEGNTLMGLRDESGAPTAMMIRDGSRTVVPNEVPASPRDLAELIRPRMFNPEDLMRELRTRGPGEPSVMADEVMSRLAAIRQGRPALTPAPEVMTPFIQSVMDVGGVFKGESLPAGERLAVGEFVLSTDGSKMMLLEGDGRLVVYDTSTGEALSTMGTSLADGSGVFAMLQLDGNLVLFNGEVKAESVLWYLNDHQHPFGGYTLDLNGTSSSGLQIVSDSTGTAVFPPVPAATVDSSEPSSETTAAADTSEPASDTTAAADTSEPASDTTAAV